MTLIDTPLGERGQYPVIFPCSHNAAMRVYQCVPGVVYASNGVACTWDTAPLVAKILDVPVPEAPVDQVQAVPGLEEYRRLFPPDVPRQYQKEDAVFLAQRRYALLCNPMRSGKSLTALMAATLTGAKRGLILCPSVAKWVWADEVAKWTGKRALLLDGLNCDMARLYCLTCMQRGRLPNGEHCPDCKARNGQSYGYNIFDVRATEEPLKRDECDEWYCRKHPERKVAAGEVEVCPLCRDELAEQLLTADWVICNYDLLTPKASRDKRGRAHMKGTMRGWRDALAKCQFEIALLDESHYLRSFTTAYSKQNSTRRAHVRKITDNVPIVWGITGTPIFGFVRDLWGQLDTISKGAFGDGIDFTRRYCAGVQGEYGWVAEGRSHEAELISRLNFIKIQRPRSEILKNMPAKQRRVLHIESEKTIPRRRNGTPRGSIGKMIAAVAPVKRPYVVANVLQELSEGLKSYVLTYRRNACEALGKAIEREMKKREWKNRMRSVNAEVWLGQTEAGMTAQARFEAARAFVEHQGAGVFIATIDSMPGGLSLRGATCVHMVDFHTSPSAMEQAEDRPYEPGSTGLSITHYAVKGSIDDDLEAIVIPKFQNKDKLLNDENAQHVLQAFNITESEEETIEEVWARHCAHLGEDDEEEFI